MDWDLENSRSVWTTWTERIKFKAALSLWVSHSHQFSLYHPYLYSHHIFFVFFFSSGHLLFKCSKEFLFIRSISLLSFWLFVFVKQRIFSLGVNHIVKPWNDHKFCNMFWFVVYLLYFSRILCYLNWVQLVNFDFFRKSEE